MLKERRESARRKESRFPPPPSLSSLFFSGYSERERVRTGAKRRERKKRASERASTRAEDGCCCCGRGITSAPLTRKTFRLNLVLDSARLLSTHPNRPAFLARPKRSANSPPPFPLSPPPHTLQVLPDRCRTAAEPPALGTVYLTPFRSYQHK